MTIKSQSSEHFLPKGNFMDFNDAVKTINKLLKEKRPDTFNSTWIRKHAPHVYRFVQKNVRSEIGTIDWDRVTRSLDRKLQRKWNTTSRNRKISYRKTAEVGLVLNKYHDKLYIFLSPANKNDEYLRDMISISLVRIAQKGNIIAREEIIKLVRFTIDDWIVRYHTLSSWEGYEPLIQKRIEGCIRCYRYSGSFMRYLFRTLEYAGRGLRPIAEYSSYSGKKYQ
jgi:hypothetical protein